MCRGQRTTFKVSSPLHHVSTRDQAGLTRLGGKCASCLAILPAHIPGFLLLPELHSGKDPQTILPSELNPHKRHGLCQLLENNKLGQIFKTNPCLQTRPSLHICGVNSQIQSTRFSQHFIPRHDILCGSNLPKVEKH